MRYCVISILLVMSFQVYSQSLPVINESEVNRIEKTLASDDMQGRKVFTPGIERAASFIIREFNDAGLKPWTGNKDFKQSFTMVDPEITEVDATIDGSSFDKKNLIVFSTESSLTITPGDHYQKVFIKTPADFRPTILKYLGSGDNVLILVDTAMLKNFTRLAGMHFPQFEGSGNHIIILTATDPRQYSIQVKQKIRKRELTNLIGIIPGKSKPNEYVIFSAHYDHLGIGKPDAAGDSIYNGANDDASGTTAVIMLAHYFQKNSMTMNAHLFLLLSLQKKLENTVLYTFQEKSIQIR